VAALLLAGCSAKARTAAVVVPTSGPAEVDDATGGIEGVVTDEEQVVLAGVDVGIPPLELYAQTDAAGRFSLSHVPPGTHNLMASAIGYGSGAQQVAVEAGAVASVQLQLVRLAAPQKIRHETLTLNGFLNCGVGAVAVRATDDCTSDPNHKAAFELPVDANVTSIVGEMVWQPNAGVAAHTLELDLWQNPRCSPCNPQYRYAEAKGTSPVVVRANAPFKGVAAEGTTKLHWYVWTPWQQDEPPVVVLVFNQPYTIYSTQFFGAPAAPDFSAIPT
jgi:carboxypeptidase family protein